MRTPDPSENAAAIWTETPETCQWNKLAKHVLPFACTRLARPGRNTCAQHQAELDLRLFELQHPGAKLAWVISWAEGSSLMRRCGPDEVARVLMDRHPNGLLSQAKDQTVLELRDVYGRLVAMIRRQESIK